MIAIPDFAAGAMENWGLITYREARVLYQPGVASLGDMESAAMTIAHELGHMVRAPCRSTMNARTVL
jgi:aminopeptidase N